MRRLIKEDSENAIQAAFFRWLNVQARLNPELELFHSIPNGSHKSPASRMIYKATGLKSGVPDCFLPVARGGWNGLYIEFKSEKGRVSPEQLFWISRLREQNFIVYICRDWERAATLTSDYLRGKINEKDFATCTPKQNRKPRKG